MKPLNHLVRPVLRRVRPERAALEDMQLCVDRVWYSETYTDVAPTGLDPVEHFIQRGALEGRRPNRFFDPIWYVQRYQEAAGQLPILHYATKGRRKRYDPGPAFSATAYLAAHRDVAASGIDPLDHYILHGQQEQRAVTPADTSEPSPKARSNRTAHAFPRMSEDELPGREQLARVQEVFALRDAGVSCLRVADLAVAAVQPPAPPLSPEQVRGSPFWFYNCFLNAEGTILRYARQNLTPHKDYLTNFLGVKLAPRIVGEDHRRSRRPGRSTATSLKLARRPNRMDSSPARRRPLGFDLYDGRAGLHLGLLDDQRRCRRTPHGADEQAGRGRGRESHDLPRGCSGDERLRNVRVHAAPR